MHVDLCPRIPALRLSFESIGRNGRIARRIGTIVRRNGRAVRRNGRFVRRIGRIGRRVGRIGGIAVGEETAIRTAVFDRHCCRGKRGLRQQVRVQRVRGAPCFHCWSQDGVQPGELLPAHREADVSGPNRTRQDPKGNADEHEYLYINVLAPGSVV